MVGLSVGLPCLDAKLVFPVGTKDEAPQSVEVFTVVRSVRL